MAVFGDGASTEVIKGKEDKGVGPVRFSVSLFPYAHKKEVI